MECATRGTEQDHSPGEGEMGIIVDAGISVASIKSSSLYSLTAKKRHGSKRPNSKKMILNFTFSGKWRHTQKRQLKSEKAAASLAIYFAARHT